MGVFHVFKIAQMDSNRAKRLICSLAIKVHDGDFIITTVARRPRLAFNKAKKLFQRNGEGKNPLLHFEILPQMTKVRLKYFETNLSEIFRSAHVQTYNFKG